VPLGTKLAHAAASLCHKHTLAAADAIIYATALAMNAERVICDARSSPCIRRSTIARISASSASDSSM